MILDLFPWRVFDRHACYLRRLLDILTVCCQDSSENRLNATLYSVARMERSPAMHVLNGHLYKVFKQSNF